MSILTPSRRAGMALSALLICVTAAPSPAQSAPPDCEELAASAGADAGIPAGLLPAMARVESGKSIQGTVKAWPWTLNNAGNGTYHDSLPDALARLDTLLASGTRNVDLGCMQLNWRWHSSAFADASAMMDPKANTRYAAAFLRDLHQRHGTWTAAVAHYHSSDSARGKAYAAKVARVHEQIVAAPAPPIHMACPDGSRPRNGRATPTKTPTKTPTATACPQTSGLLTLAGRGLFPDAQPGDLRHSTATRMPLVTRPARNP